MVKRRFLSIIIIILSLAFISLAAYRDNALREGSMAEAYLNKIWIASDWAGETYKGFYFSFNKIEGRTCEGGLGKGDFYSIFGGSYLWGADYNFSGTLHGNTAECRFADCEGVAGSMAFIFVNDSEIEAVISYDGEYTTERKTFRPYNVKDIDCLTLQEEPTVQVDLDHWGPVYFVAGIKSEEGNTWPRPRAYLVNGNQDVLCEFYSSFHVGTKIYDVVFKDMNGDGLKDAVVSTCFVNNGIEIEGMPHIHWLFLQTDNWFKCETAWLDSEKDWEPGLSADDKGEEAGTEAGDGTWKQEYESCMAFMKQGISERGMAGQQEQENFKKETWKRVVELWQDSHNAFGKCVETCVENQPGGMDGEECVYRTATLLMAAMCGENGGSYKFRYGHGEDTEKAQEDFRAVIEGENPIDESMDSLRGDFGIYYYADTLIIEMERDAWQEEFFHCLDTARDRAGESGDGDKEQLLDTLEALEDFFGAWTKNERACKRLKYQNRIGLDVEEGNEWIELEIRGLRIWQAEGEAEIFRTGTLLLIDGLERSGGSYEFIYEEEPDRQELTKLLGIRPGMEEGTWKQEYELCLAAMELAISRYDVTGDEIAYEELSDYYKQASDRSKELWRDALSAFDEYVAACIRNQPGGRGGEEYIYRAAVLLMKITCERSDGHYTFAHGHGEDLEKAQEDFRAVIEGENPIDECWESFYWEFGSHTGIIFTISGMRAEAWQGEFYHCLDTARDRAGESGDKEQLLETLEALEDFLEAWAEDEEEYRQIEGGSSMSILIAGDRAEVFRTGTMLLIDGLEKSGGSYEFLYDGEADRQALINICEGAGAFYQSGRQ